MKLLNVGVPLPYKDDSNTLIILSTVPSVYLSHFFDAMFSDTLKHIILPYRTCTLEYNGTFRTDEDGLNQQSDQTVL